MDPTGDNHYPSQRNTRTNFAHPSRWGNRRRSSPAQSPRRQADQNLATAEQVANAKTSYSEALATLRKYNFKAYATRMHQHRDKTGTLLAWLAKQDSETQPITEIVDPFGHLARAQGDILQAFHRYYAGIYRAPQSHDLTAIPHFLDQLRLPLIPETDRATLDSTISHTEISQAIRALANNKAPGLDGLPLEYFSTFSLLLSPRLEAMYAEALERRATRVSPGVSHRVLY